MKIAIFKESLWMTEREKKKRHFQAFTSSPSNQTIYHISMVRCDFYRTVGWITQISVLINGTYASLAIVHVCAPFAPNQKAKHTL